MSVTTAILFCIIVVWIVHNQRKRDKRPKNRPWIYHDWNGVPTPQQKKTFHQYKTRTLKEHIKKRN